MARNPSKTANKHVTEAHRAEVSWTGPLPPPAALEHFDRIIPGGASRILEMAEREQSHRIKLENSMLASETSDTRRGQWFGAGVAFAALIGAVLTVLYGAHPSVSIALVSVPVLGIVKALVDGRSSKRQD